MPAGPTLLVAAKSSEARKGLLASRKRPTNKLSTTASLTRAIGLSPPSRNQDKESLTPDAPDARVRPWGRPGRPLLIVHAKPPIESRHGKCAPETRLCPDIGY